MSVLSFDIKQKIDYINDLLVPIEDLGISVGVDNGFVVKNGFVDDKQIENEYEFVDSDNENRISPNRITKHNGFYHNVLIWFPYNIYEKNYDNGNYTHRKDYFKDDSEYKEELYNFIEKIENKWHVEITLQYPDISVLVVFTDKKLDNI